MFNLQVLNQIASAVGFSAEEAIAALTTEQIEYRITDAYLTDHDNVDAAFDNWIDYAESKGWDPEFIDVHLGLC